MMLEGFVPTGVWEATAYDERLYRLYIKNIAIYMIGFSTNSRSHEWP